MLEGSTFLSLGTLACLVLVFKIIMTWVHSLIACWLLLFPAVCSKTTHPSSLVRAIGEDVVFQFNSTQPMHWAYWGTIRNNSKWLSLILIRKDANKPPKLHDDLTLFTYNGRVSFVGNLTAGHAWFKLRNLRLDDSNYYGARIRLKGQRQQLYSTFLKVQVARFTEVPPRKLYVAIGQNVKIVWDYVAGNKTADFDIQSPRWEVYNSVHGWKTLGADHSTSGWQWKLSASCPARLQNPTRVSKTSTASLVIYDVTTEDSGIYRCNLTLRDQPPVTSTTQLIVTETSDDHNQQSRINNEKPSIVYLKSVTEVPSSPGDRIMLWCIFNGFPYPNVTWYKPNEEPIRENVTSSSGWSSISLDIKDAKDYGKYKCRVENILGYSEQYITVETTDDHNQQPKINNGKNPYFIAFIILIIIAGLLLVIAIVGFVIKKCYHACRTNRMSFDNVHEMSKLTSDKGQG